MKKVLEVQLAEHIEFINGKASVARAHDSGMTEVDGIGNVFPKRGKYS